MHRNHMMEQTSAELARRTHQVQAWWLPIAVLVGAVAFGVLALLARTIWYFPIDLELIDRIRSRAGRRTGMLAQQIASAQETAHGRDTDVRTLCRDSLRADDARAAGRLSLAG